MNTQFTPTKNTITTTTTTVKRTKKENKKTRKNRSVSRKAEIQDFKFYDSISAFSWHNSQQLEVDKVAHGNNNNNCLTQ